MCRRWLSDPVAQGFLLSLRCHVGFVFERFLCAITSTNQPLSLRCRTSGQNAWSERLPGEHRIFPPSSGRTNAPSPMRRSSRVRLLNGFAPPRIPGGRVCFRFKLSHDLKEGEGAPWRRWRFPGGHLSGASLAVTLVGPRRGFVYRSPALNQKKEPPSNERPAEGALRLPRWKSTGSMPSSRGESRDVLVHVKRRSRSKVGVPVEPHRMCSVTVQTPDCLA